MQFPLLPLLLLLPLLPVSPCQLICFPPRSSPFYLPSEKSRTPKDIYETQHNKVQ